MGKAVDEKTMNDLKNLHPLKFFTEFMDKSLDEQTKKKLQETMEGLKNIEPIKLLRLESLRVPLPVLERLSRVKDKKSLEMIDEKKQIWWFNLRKRVYQLHNLNTETFIQDLINLKIEVNEEMEKKIRNFFNSKDNSVRDEIQEYVHSHKEKRTNLNDKRRIIDLALKIQFNNTGSKDDPIEFIDREEEEFEKTKKEIIIEYIEKLESKRDVESSRVPYYQNPEYLANYIINVKAGLYASDSSNDQDLLEKLKLISITEESVKEVINEYRKKMEDTVPDVDREGHTVNKESSEDSDSSSPLE